MPNKTPAVGFSSLLFLPASLSLSTLPSLVSRALQLAYTVAEGWQIYQVSLPSKAEEETFLEVCRRELFSKGVSLGFRPASLEPKALFFDMDATVIEEESLDELAKFHGCEEAVARLTDAAMRGDLSSAEALKRRLALLQGLPVECLEQLAESLTLQRGMREVSAYCRARAIPLFLVSGGFLGIADRVAERLGFADVLANRFQIANGRLSGSYHEPLVDGKAKALWVREKIKALGLSSSQVIAVGDGANDRQMMTEVGLAVGFHPKPALTSVVHVVNFSHDHRLLLWLIDPHDKQALRFL